MFVYFVWSVVKEFVENFEKEKVDEVDEKIGNNGKILDDKIGYI